MCHQEDFLVIIALFVFWFHVYRSELTCIQSAVEIASRHNVRMDPAKAGRPGNKFIAHLTMRWDHHAFFLTGAIDFRRNKLSMPVYKLRSVGVVEYCYGNRLAFPHSDQRPR